MKLYRVDYHHPEGHEQDWSASKRGANDSRRAMNRKFDITHGEAEVTIVDIPTKRAALIEWLRKNPTR